MNSLRGNLTELVNYFFIHKFEQLTVILKERGDVKYLQDSIANTIVSPTPAICRR